MLLVDTGASKTVFDKKRVLHFIDEKDFLPMDKLSTGLGTSSMKTHSTLLKKLQVGEIVMKNFEAIVLDLSHVNISYSKLDLPAIDGVLGSDVLVKYNAVIDYRKKELKLRSR